MLKSDAFFQTKGLMTGQGQSLVTVWPLLVRLIHWLLAGCVLVNCLNESGYWHRLIGYIGILLVLVRICYGLWFTRHDTAKFYLPDFAATSRHIRELLSGRVSVHTGHNPLGQYAVYAIWLLIALLALTGWLSRTDAYWGEDWPVAAHLVLSYLLQGMVVAHLMAVLIMSILQRRNLIRAMLRGR